MSDYEDMLRENGFTEAMARAISENPLDQVPLEGGWLYRIGPSAIEGQGVFAAAYFFAGQVIAPARLGNQRTPPGRYANHTKEPNAQLVSVGPDLYLMAVQSIDADEEITVNYRQSVAANVQAGAAVNERILAELVTLNKAIREILCFQKLQGMRHAAQSSSSGLGPCTSDVHLGGESRLPDS